MGVYGARTLSAVGPIATRRLLLRLRRRLVGVLAILALAAVVAVHHADMPVPTGGLGAMPGMTHDAAPSGHHGGEDGGGTPMAMVACIAAMVAIGAGVLAVALGSLPVRWAAVLRQGAPVARPLPRPALSRAGPPGPSGLCIWRI